MALSFPGFGNGVLRRGCQPGLPTLEGEKFGGSGFGCRAVVLLGESGSIWYQRKAPPQDGRLFGDAPGLFLHPLWLFFFFFALLKGNSSVSMLADLETAGSGLTAQPAVLALAN